MHDTNASADVTSSFGGVTAKNVQGDLSVKSNNGSLQLGALSRIQASDAILAHLKPDLETLAQWEQIEEIEQAIGEKRLADRVLPSGKRTPLESARLNE